MQPFASDSSINDKVCRRRLALLHSPTSDKYEGRKVARRRCEEEQPQSVEA